MQGALGQIALRPANKSDALILFRWANDRAVRTSSFHPDSISWRSHIAWLTSKLNDSGCKIYIVLNSQAEPIGQVRFETVSAGHLEVDVSIQPEKRGLGYGVLAIRSACETVAADLYVQRIDAVVKASNGPSQAAFQKAGFSVLGYYDSDGEQVTRYRYPTGTSPRQ